RFVHGAVELQRKPGAGLALGLDLEQLRGDIAHLFRGLAPGLVPLLAAERMQRRGFGRGAGIAVDQVQLRDRHVQAVALGVFDVEVFAGLAASLQRDQPAVAADTVVLVDDRRAFGQLAEVADDRLWFAAGALAAAWLGSALREQLALGEDRDARRVERETVLERGHRDGEAGPGDARIGRLGAGCLGAA